MPDALLATAVCLFLVLAVILVFGQTTQFKFINCDDQDYVFHNQAVRDGLTWHGIQWAFTTNEASNWHPLTWLSHMLDYQIYGVRSGGHHSTSVLLHAANAVLLFLVLWRMTGGLWPCAFVAAVFAVHPLRAESVAWVAERKDVLSGLFFMLTLAAYVGYVRHPFSLAGYLTVAATFALGLMAKPMLVTLPCVLLLLDFWPLRRMPWSWRGGTDGGSDRTATRGATMQSSSPQGLSPPQSWLRLIVEKLPLLALSAGSCAATVWAQRKAIALNEYIDFPSRLANAVVSSIGYVVQFFHPANLAPMYPHPELSLPAWKVGGALLALAAISAAAVIGWRRHPYLIVGWLWYLGMLMPVIGLVQVGSQAMADRYTYLPQIGLCIAVTWGAACLVASWPHRRWLYGAVAAFVLLDLGFCGWQQTSCWCDSETLWSHTLDCVPRNSMAHYGLGCALSERHLDEEAVAEFESALEIRPSFGLAHFNLGLALERLRRTDDAIAHYRQAVKYSPELADVHYNLGAMLASHGETDEAIAEFRNTLEIDHNHANAYYNLAICLGNQGKNAEAIACWREALRLKPDDMEVVDQMAWMLATCPDASIRNGKEAVELAQRAEDLSKGANATPLGTLAAAYAEVGRFSEAVETAQRAIDLAVRHGDTATADAFRAQMKFYRANRPYREPPGQPR